MSASVANRATLGAAAARRRSGWRRRLALTRASVVFHQLALDRELATGVDPASSAQLALRAAQLTGRRNRRRLADGLGALLARARRPRARSSAITPRANLMRSRTVLEALQRRLRSNETLSPEGVAMLKLLLSDMASPLYALGDSEELSSVLRLVAASLTDRSAGA